MRCDTIDEKQYNLFTDLIVTKGLEGTTPSNGPSRIDGTKAQSRYSKTVQRTEQIERGYTANAKSECEIAKRYTGRKKSRAYTQTLSNQEAW
jgi:hypothetical protein